ncbi:MAG: hypothetical protein H0U13_12000 [Gemmatimonadaceae bacterium]|nr:hypothetical protein [Gemmatimonadaceae bacterium]
MTDYATLDQINIVARRITPIEGAYLIWKRVFNEDSVLMHEYTIFAGLASEWDEGKKSARPGHRAELADAIRREAHLVLRRN